METLNEQVQRASRRLAPVGRAGRRVGAAVTSPNARKGMAVAGVVVVAIGAGILAAVAGLPGDSVSGWDSIATSGGGSTDRQDANPARLCPTCGGRGVVGPHAVECAGCFGAGFIRD